MDQFQLYYQMNINYQNLGRLNVGLATRNSYVFKVKSVMTKKLQEILSILLFVVLSCYVGFSAVRFGSLLWQRLS